MFAVLFLSFGCATNANLTNTETSDFETTMDDLFSDVIISKDFDVKTNKLETFAGITYQIPVDWKEQNSDEDTKYYYPPSAMLMVAFEDNPINIMNDESRSSFFEGFAEQFDNFELKSAILYTIDGLYGIKCEAEFIDGDPVFLEGVLFDTSYSFVSFLLFTFTNGGVDYSSDFDKILASIEISNEPEDTTKVPDTTKVQDTTTVPDTTKAPETTKSPETELPEVGMTINQKNALKKANSYLDFSNFSYQGLIEQLQYEGFSYSDAQYAVDNCGADWNEQALGKAKSYLEFSAFSYNGLKDQLEYEEFTSSQIKYAVDNCGADWNEQAVKKAKSYLKYMAFSYQGLIEQLEYEGFTHEQAVYGANSTGLN